MAFVAQTGRTNPMILISDTTANPPMSTKEMEEKISSIQANEIEQIGVKIVEKIVNNLGPGRKAHILRQIDQIRPREKKPMPPLKGLIQSTALRAANRPFLTDEQTLKLMNSLLSSVKQKITQSFSTPGGFVDGGLFFQISDRREECEPETTIADFVSKGAKKAGITLSEENVPTQYCVRLELDQKLTQEKQALIFAVSQQSEGVEFARMTFSLRDLEDGSTSETD
jgi:hypothetical protein